MSTTTRNVTVFTTVGRSGNIIATSAKTWGELKSDLDDADVDYDEMRVVLYPSKHTLEVDDAALPEGDIKLFLTPLRTKSGSGEKVQVQAIIAEYGDRAKKHFNKDKNYTNKSGDVLAKLLVSWNKKGLAPVAAAPSKGSTTPKAGKTGGGSKLKIDQELLEKEAKEIERAFRNL